MTQLTKQLKARIVTSGFLAAGLLAAGSSCASRTFHGEGTAPAPGGSDARPKIFGSLFGGVAPFGLLADNDTASREKLAVDLEKNYADILGSTQASHAAMAALVRSLVASLRSQGALPCDANETLTLYRGHGIGALPAARGGKPWAPSDALYDEPPSLPALEMAGSKPVARGRSYEEDIDASWKGRKISLRAKHDAFAASDAWDAVNKAAFGVRIDPASFSDVAGRHSHGAWGSPLLSTTLDPNAAVAFRAPFLRIRVCPGRALPTTLTKFSNEKELLLFGLLLPEEIEVVHFPEASGLTRALMGNASSGKASSQAVDAATQAGAEWMKGFLDAESKRTATPFEACLAKAFEADTSDVATSRLLESLKASPRAPSAGFLKASTDVCGS